MDRVVRAFSYISGLDRSIGGRLLARASLALAISFLGSSAGAVTLGFGALPSPPSFNGCQSYVGGVTTEGFDFSATSNTGSARIGACGPGTSSTAARLSYNGTTRLSLTYVGSENTGAEYSMVSSSGDAFSLLSFDYGEFFEIGDFAFDANATSLLVEGIVGGSVVASQTLVLDLNSDGPFGAVDFQTAVFGAAFTALDSVRITPTSTLGAGGLFAETAVALIDNVEVAVIPEPSTALLLGIGLAALARRRGRR